MPAPDAGVADCLGALGDAALDAERAVRGIETGSADGARRNLTSRRDRDGLRSIGFWTTPEAWRQLHHLVIDECTTAETLLNTAMNLLFIDRGLPVIAPSRLSAAPKVNDVE